MAHQKPPANAFKPLKQPSDSEDVPLSGKKWRARLVAAAAIIGPGIIAASMVNDAPGIATYAIAGANYGYSILWMILVSTLVLTVVQEMAARMGAVTGKGLSDLVREVFGLRVTFQLLVGLLIANLGTTVAEFAGIAASLEIFGISRYISVPLGGLFVWLLLVKGSYDRVEKAFLFGSLFFILYVISGIMVHPPWPEVLRATVSPTWHWDAGFISTMVALIGTTVTPWMQFFLQSSIVDKRIKIDDYAVSRLDVIVGCIAANVIVFFIIVTAAATLHPHGIRVESAADAARALEPFAGHWAEVIFALGLFNASLFGAAILPLSTSYSICEGFGWESGVDKTWREAPWFFGIYTALIVVSALAILIPGAPLIPIMFWSQVLNGVLLPFVLIIMLKLVNNRRLMGEHVNSPFGNVIAWSAAGLLFLLSALMLVFSLVPGLTA
ncbi:MAG: divalent metal cation transporter [Candidatus Sericytochromatia bacterium]|nr:divalent metal cation transporter [Candidatus Sericytochromatia bacterium]